MATASPASTAPAGRRTPNVTVTASHTTPMNAGALTLVIGLETSATRAPPRPAMAAATVNTATLVRSTEIPDVRAATSELRTASIARPDAERCRFVTIHATNPMTAASTTSSWRSSLRSPTRSSVNTPRSRSYGPTTGRATDQPAPWLDTPWSWNSRRSPVNASASVPRASASPPRRNDSRATPAPRAPTTVAATRAASTNGTPSDTSQPATNPPLVTNIAWPRLTMPPMPVTTTNDRNTRPSANPRAARPRQKGSATHSAHEANPMPATSSGRRRSHGDRPAPGSAGGPVVATEPAVRPARSDRTNSRPSRTRNGTAARKPVMSASTSGT